MVRKVYIGQYSNGNQCGIHTLGIDDSTGEITELSHAFGFLNTIWLALSDDASRLYASRDNGISVFDATGGELCHITDYETNHTQPCHLSLSSDGSRLYFAEYTDATCGMVELGSGRLTMATLTGSGPNPARQESAHPHCAIETPEGRYLYVTDLGSDSVWVFASRNLTLRHKIDTKPRGAGPRHVAFHPNGSFAYINFELANTVAAYCYRDGMIDEIQQLPLLPSGFTGASQAAALKISDDGKRLYATNRGHDSVAVFDINPDTGKLKLIAHSPLGGSWSRDFTILPGGHIAVGCLEREGEVRTFSLNSHTGRFQPLPFTVKMHRPVVAVIEPERRKTC